MAVGGTTWGSPWDRVCVRPSRKGSIAFGPDTFASHKSTLRNRPSRGYEPRRGPTNGTGGSHPVHDLASARTGRRGRLLPAGSPALDPRERWRPGWATTMRCGRNSTIRQLRRTNSHSSRPRRTAARCDRSGGESAPERVDGGRAGSRPWRRARLWRDDRGASPYLRTPLRRLGVLDAVSISGAASRTRGDRFEEELPEVALRSANGTRSTRSSRNGRRCVPLLVPSICLSQTVQPRYRLC